jgi:hypothetical protein
MAKRAGFPPEHLPEFKTASIFWNIVIEQALHGRTDVEVLIDEAIRQFPYHQRFGEYKVRISVASASTNVQSEAVLSTPVLQDPAYTADWPRKSVAHYNKLELDLLRKCIDSGAEVLLVRGFHDKFVVVPDVVINGSANVTYSGLYLNRERLSLYNQSSAPQDYATVHTVCENHIATARLAGRCTPPHNPAGLADTRSLSEIRRCFSASWT